MAVVIVQSNPGTSGAGTADTYTVTLGSDTTSGNEVIITVSSDATVATPTGFTVDRSQVNNNGHYVFRKSTSGETASWVIDPGGSSATTWNAYEVSGLDLGSGVDQVQSTGGAGDDSTRSTGTTGTTDTADEWLFATIGSSNNDHSDAIGVASWTNSFIEQDDIDSTKGVDTDVGVATAFRTVSATATFETTGTYEDDNAGTGIIVTYRIAAVAAAVYPPFPQRQNTLVRM